MKKKRNKYDIVIAICAAVLVTVSTILICERISGIKADSAQRDARKLMEQGMRNASPVRIEPVAEAPSDQSERSEQTRPALDPEPAESTDEEQETRDGFLLLLEQNEHFVGWLTAGESIDYPVVQDDNEYYLTRNFFDEHDKNGVPFMDEHNRLLPKDDVLIIYGHNMKSGAMFGRLRDYLDADYLSDHPVVSFRTIHDDEDVYYTPIAAFHASTFRNNRNFFDARRINFDSEETYQSYLDEVTGRSAWKARVDAVPGDRLLVLMTCSYVYDYGRLLLVCRELRENESPESISALYADPVK